MASKNAETSAGNGVESGPSSESNEHDYAHSAETNFTSAEASSSGTQSATVQPSSSSSSLQVELPEPALGAEVDCPGGNDIESQNGSDSRKTAATKPAAVSRGRRRPSRVDARARQRDANCCCCKTEFERQGRSFNRRAVYTFTNTETVHWAFPGCVVHDKSFLCETCAQVIRSKCSRRQSGKRTLWVKPPVTKKVSYSDITVFECLHSCKAPSALPLYMLQAATTLI